MCDNGKVCDDVYEGEDDERFLAHAKSALTVLQEMTASRNEDNPWLGVCAAVALLQLRSRISPAAPPIPSDHPQLVELRQLSESQTRQIRQLERDCQIWQERANERINTLTGLEAEVSELKAQRYCDREKIGELESQNHSLREQLVARVVGR